MRVVVPWISELLERDCVRSTSRSTRHQGRTQISIPVRLLRLVFRLHDPPKRRYGATAATYLFSVVELVALRRVAPRPAAQRLPANRANRSSRSAAARGGVVAARQPLPLNRYAATQPHSVIAFLKAPTTSGSTGAASDGLQTERILGNGIGRVARRGWKRKRGPAGILL